LKIRKYGVGDRVLVLVHGGPGGAGSLSCMARQYAEYGKGKVCILEPWQSAKTMWGQVEELHQQILSATNKKVFLLGHSWGAWIVALYASKYPDSLEFVVLMSSGPFDDQYIPAIKARRERLLHGKHREAFERLTEEISHMDAADQKEKFALFAAIPHGDDYDVFEEEDDCVPNGEIYQSVWPEGAKMRSEGRLLEEAKKIQCPIYIIHGEEDPHPIEGVTGPFDEKGIQYILYTIGRCGHSPWKERYGRDKLREFIFDQLIEPLRDLGKK